MWSCTADIASNSSTFLVHSTVCSLGVWFSQETWLDKTAWAIKATKGLRRRVWHAKTFCKCKVWRQKKTHMHMWETNTDNPFFSSFPCFLLLLISIWKFLFMQSPSASASLQNSYYCPLRLGQREAVGCLTLKHVHKHCRQKGVYCTCWLWVPAVCCYCTYSSTPLTQCCVTNTLTPLCFAAVGNCLMRPSTFYLYSAAVDNWIIVFFQRTFLGVRIFNLP